MIMTDPLAWDNQRFMELRRLNVGCFGGGTGLPSLLGGLKSNPWLTVNAVVTMFDSGGSSGQLRDELGVLPPGDVLKCALALARNEREARRVLLARLPMLEHARLRGHTGGNLLLSMMEQYSGDFLAAVDGLRALLGCAGRVWPVSVEQARLCAEYGDGTQTSGEVEVDAGQTAGNAITRLWLEPDVRLHDTVAAAIPRFDAAIIGPGSFYTSLMPIFLVKGAPEAIQQVKGPVILVTNLLTEGRGMWHFTAGEAVWQMSHAIGRPIDVVLVNTASPVRRHAGALPRRAQAAAPARRRAGLVRGRQRRVLVRRDRAARSPAPGARRLGGAREAAVVGQLPASSFPLPASRFPLPASPAESRVPYLMTAPVALIWYCVDAFGSCFPCSPAASLASMSLDPTASNTPSAETFLPLALIGNTMTPSSTFSLTVGLAGSVPSTATAIQQPIMAHTAVATPSTRTVLPTNSFGLAVNDSIGVAFFSATPLPSFASSRPAVRPPRR